MAMHSFPPFLGPPLPELMSEAKCTDNVEVFLVHILFVFRVEFCGHMRSVDI